MHCTTVRRGMYGYGDENQQGQSFPSVRLFITNSSTIAAWSWMLMQLFSRQRSGTKRLRGLDRQNMSLGTTCWCTARRIPRMWLSKIWKVSPVPSQSVIRCSQSFFRALRMGAISVRAVQIRVPPQTLGKQPTPLTATDTSLGTTMASITHPDRSTKFDDSSI